MWHLEYEADKETISLSNFWYGMCPAEKWSSYKLVPNLRNFESVSFTFVQRKGKNELTEAFMSMVVTKGVRCKEHFGAKDSHVLLVK